jgi:hypothetical protein
MKNPLWFDLIHQWKEMGKGEYGITFPFLIGAIALAEQKEPTALLIKQVFDEMQHHSIEGHYCEVRWCGNIDEPVISINKSENASRVALDDVCMVDGHITMGFTNDLMNGFHLNCDTADEALNWLFSYTEEKVQNRQFSKSNGIFGAFSEEDLAFINKVHKLNNI